MIIPRFSENFFYWKLTDGLRFGSDSSVTITYESMYGINQSWHIRIFHNFFYFESSKCYEFKGFLQWNFITEWASARSCFPESDLIKILQLIEICVCVSLFKLFFNSIQKFQAQSAAKPLLCHIATCLTVWTSEARTQSFRTVINSDSKTTTEAQLVISRLQTPECVLSTTGSCFRSAVRSLVQSLFPNALTIGGRIFGHYPSST